MTRTACFAPLLVMLAAVASAAENPALPKESPFKNPATAATPTQAAETLELAGVSAMGKRTDLIIYDKAAKKSHWIGMGETKDGITVLNYDARREQAVVKVNGTQKVLPLRKGTGPVNTPAGVAPVATGFNVAPSLPAGADVVKVQPPPPASPAPNAPATAPAPAPGTPEAQVKQETEARMLVSDLLEIGMAQRKAYEEAQRRAAEGQTNPSAQPAPAANQPAPPAQEQPKQE